MQNPDVSPALDVNNKYASIKATTSGVQTSS